MGVDFLCDEFSYHCSYGNWDKMRVELLRATVKYLETSDIPLKRLNNHNEQVPYYDIVDGFLSHKDDLTSIGVFMQMSHEVKDFDNTLIYFDVYGLHALLKKNDCEGVYSPGNAVDICKLIELVGPHVGEDFQNQLITVTKLFSTSVATKSNIYLT